MLKDISNHGVTLTIVNYMDEEKNYSEETEVFDVWLIMNKMLLESSESYIFRKKNGVIIYISHNHDERNTV